MGNVPSQQGGVPDAAASSLSPRAQQRLSQAPTYMNFFEVAAVAPAAPPSKPKKRPPTTSDKSSATSRSSEGSITSPRVSHEKRPSTSTTASVSNLSSSGRYNQRSGISLPNTRASTISDTSTLANSHYRHHRKVPADKATKLEYATLDGRRYLTSPDARFFLPVDEDESDRLVIMHFLLKYAFSCSFKAPVADLLRGGAKVLDIGCGPGTWVLEMASDFPNADIFGVDLVPMYPSAIKPGNAKFLQHDILHSLPFPDNSLDYVHMRMMLCNLTQAQTIRLLAEINRVLKPSGFVELVDVEYRVQRAGPMSEELLNRKLYETMRCHDVDFQLCPHLSTLLMTQGGGFIDVRQDRITIPLGWGGQLGQIHAQNMETFFNSLHPSIRNACITSEFPDGLTIDALQNVMLECQKYQSHLNWHSCYGQKPIDTISPPAPPTVPPPTPPINCTTPTTILSTTSKRRLDKPPVVQAAGPAIVEETWESINDFVDGYID